MIRIKLYNRNNDTSTILDVNERYLQKSLAYLDAKDVGIDLYVDPGIDFNLAISYFNNILPLYYDGKAFAASFNNELSYLQFSQQLIDEYIMNKLSVEIANYIKSLDIKNNTNIGNEICKEINSFPFDVKSGIIQKISIKSLQYLVEKYPFKDWNWNSLSSNPSITPDFFEKHPRLPWEIGSGGFSQNPSFTVDFIEKYIIDTRWYWGSYGISSNTAITLKFIEDHIDKEWDWGDKGLSKNPVVTPEFVEKYINIKPWYWGRYGLSSNPSMTLRFIEKYKNKDWNWGEGGLSSNPIITPKFVEDNIDKDWNWGVLGLSSNTTITLDFIERHIDDPRWYWGKGGLSWNPVITIEFMEKYIDSKPWDWKTLSGNRNITPEFIEKHPEIYWDWGQDGLSRNPSMTIEFIEKHINERWYFGRWGLSNNPVITYLFVEKYINKNWDWGAIGLSRNIMTDKRFNTILEYLQYVNPNIEC